MPVIACEQCTSKLRVPDGSDGRSVRCPQCSHVFTFHATAELDIAANEPVPRDERSNGWDVNPREERQRSRTGDDNDERRTSRRSRDDGDRYDEPRPARRSRERDDYDDEPRYSRRSRERSRDDFDRPGYRRRKSSCNSLMVGLVIVGVVAVIGIAVAVSNGLFGSGKVIPESEWKPFEEPNRYKVLMPGSPKRSIQQEPGGLPMTAQMVEYDRNTVFLVGHSEGVIPPDRLRLPKETLLNGACDGAMKGIADDGGVEMSREPIQLGEVPGKQLIVEIKKRNARAIARVYLTNNRLYMLIAVGKGYTPEHENVKRFFNSFEIIEHGGLNQAPSGFPKMIAKDRVLPAKSPVPTTYFKFESSRGDWIGQGRNYDSGGDPISSSVIPRGVKISVGGWNAHFGAPMNENLKIGDYPEAMEYSKSGNFPGLDVNGRGHGTSNVSGEFVVWELEIQDGKIIKLAIDFTQSCDKRPPLNGKIRINSGLE